MRSTAATAWPKLPRGGRLYYTAPARRPQRYFRPGAPPPSLIRMVSSCFCVAAVYPVSHAPRLVSRRPAADERRRVPPAAAEPGVWVRILRRLGALVAAAEDAQRPVAVAPAGAAGVGGRSVPAARI